MIAFDCFKGERPPEATRYLINRNLDQLIKIAINDATLFQSTSEAKATALQQLKFILFIAQDTVSKHTETVLKALVRITTSGTDIPHAPQKIQHIVAIIGSNVRPAYYIPLVTSILGQQQFKNSTKNTIVILNMMAQMIGGAPQLNQHTGIFTSLLAHYEKAFYDTDDGLVALFDISKVLLQKLNDIPPQLLHLIFQITINLQATRSIPEHKRQETPQVFAALAQKGGFSTVADLNASEIGPSLQAMIQNKEYVHWNKTSKNRFKFDMIIRNCSSEVSRFLQDIIVVLEFLLHPQNDLEVRMDTLVLIQYILSVPELKEGLSPLSEQFLKKVLMLAIQWKVGKPQIKIRKAGVINIISLIDKGIITEQQLLDSFKDLLPHLKNCLSDDWAPQLRLASCQLLEKYLLATKQRIGDEELRELYPVLLERLDDSQNPIRLKVTAAINVFFSCRYIKFSESTFDYLVNAIFVHFDDTCPEIQSAIYVNLRHAAVVDPRLVLKHAKTSLLRMKHQQNCKELIEYCEQRIDQFLS